MALVDNLLAYYSLEGNSNDSLGGFNGTDNSITYSAGNGKISQGGGFAGTSSIRLATSFGNTVTNQFSISMWIKPTGVTTRQVLFEKSNGASNAGSSWSFELGNVSGKITMVIFIGGGNSQVSSSASITAGVWTHVAAVYNGSTIQLYVNGSASGSVGAAGNINNVTPTPAFGYYYDISLLGYTGAMDEMGVWNKALTSTEITELYNAGNGLTYPFSAPTPSPYKSNLLMMGI
jgi:hypothetical protein